MSSFDFDEVADLSLFGPADTVINSTEPTDNPVGDGIETDAGLVALESKAYPIAVTLTEKQKQLAELEASIKPQTDKMAWLKAEADRIRKEMQVKLDAIAQERTSLEESIYDTRKQIRDLSREIDGLLRQLRVELDAERKTKEFQTNALTFSKRIAQYSYTDRILPHQMEGACILANNGRAILGDKRGLGKTLTSIATCDALQVQKVLVIVPDDVLSNFVNEIAYWAPHRSVFPVGKMPRAQREFAFSMARKLDQWMMVINYSAWRKDKTIIDTIVGLGVECVIADEAHEMKNTSTSAYKGVRDIVLAENCCPKCHSIQTNKRERIETPPFGYRSVEVCTVCDFNSDNDEWEFLDRCSVKYVFPMTGTVILNKPQDLFAQLSLVDPINFKYKDDFLRSYCTQDYYTGKWKFQEGGMDRLAKRLSGKFLARDEKTAGVTRPKQSIEIHEIEMDAELYPAQFKVMQQLSKHAQIILDSGKKLSVLATIALITRKRQANVWPAGIQLKDENGDVVFSVGEEVTESIKLDTIIKHHPTAADPDEMWTGLIPDLTEDGDMELGANVVVFSQFKGPLAELERRCNAAGISVVRFDGDTPQNIRDMAKIDFDRKYREAEGYTPKWQVILANYRTGGVGLNFTAATETIILDEEWNPGKADQAFGRTDRMGQTEETNVHILRIPNTIDSWMVAINQEKQDMIDGFEQTTEGLSDALLLAMRNGDIL